MHRAASITIITIACLLAGLPAFSTAKASSNRLDYVQKRLGAAESRGFDIIDIGQYLVPGLTDIAFGSFGIMKFASRGETQVLYASDIAAGILFSYFGAAKAFSSSNYSYVIGQLSKEPGKERAQLLKSEYLCGELARRERMSRYLMAGYNLLSGGLTFLDYGQSKSFSITAGCTKIAIALYLVFLHPLTLSERTYEDIIAPFPESASRMELVPVIGPDFTALALTLRY